MAMNRILGRALIVAAALSVPAFAAADEASPLCDHEKMEGKTPTAEKSDSKDTNKSGKKGDEKSDPKQDEKTADKS